FAGQGKGTDPTAPHEEHHPRVELGGPLYGVKGRPLDPIVDMADPDVNRMRGQPVVVPDCHLVTIDKQEASSGKDGILSVIGRTVDHEPPDGSPLPTTWFFIEGKKREFAYMRLKEGHIVEHGQVVALIDPTTALNEIANKEAKIKYAMAEHKAAIAL